MFPLGSFPTTPLTPFIGYKFLFASAIFGVRPDLPPLMQDPVIMLPISIVKVFLIML